ncbi:acyl-CoA dehydrogenase family protein [Pollutimonas bauzanensis]|uniref:Acyl-CoA dehydrogenase n=1 Tax=Pollutimonas bauzanensis TaxID=658167 RepID=A0A1M5V475_9BURK|nr:acyl-CoA dehydrogenase family protein [Pollutimonas bauzanensis]SHH69938.1 acyl-CoA dehydrogenase [Pollutimonas bauzanensis]
MFKQTLKWPFFDEKHRELEALEGFARDGLGDLIRREHAGDDVYALCPQLVSALGAGGWLGYGASLDGRLDSRSLCLARDILARQSGLAEFAFAMQGLGSAAITLFGSGSQRQSWLPGVIAGERIAAFALSEEGAGSNPAEMTTSARRVAGGWVIDGEKTWISNAGLAHQYVVFARTREAAGSQGLSCFVVEADAPGFCVADRIDVIAPHPLGALRFEDCRVPEHALIGQEGEGFKIAMSVLDVFRSSVGASAVGMARRALDHALLRVSARQISGASLASYQMTQDKLADMATAIDAAALLVYRAAWVKDVIGGRSSREAAMAKLFATEEAQRVIDKAVQLFGGLGVVAGNPAERLYREIRALRIYEGTSEIQKLIIAGQLLRTQA